MGVLSTAPDLICFFGLFVLSHADQFTATQIFKVRCVSWETLTVVASMRITTNEMTDYTSTALL